MTPYAEAFTPPLPAPPAEREPAAQVQGRLRGLPGGPRLRRDQRHRLARARARARRPAPSAASACTVGGRHGHPVHVGGGARSTSSRPPRCWRSPRRSCACSTGSGDYEHRQRNRMKFLIRSSAGTRWKAEVERELDGGPRRGRRPRCPSIPRRPARRPPSRAAATRRRTHAPSARGAGRVPPCAARGRRGFARVGARPTCARSGRPATRLVTVDAAARRRHGGAAARSRRRCRPRYGDGTRAHDARPEPRPALGARLRTCGALHARARRRPGSPARGARHARRRDELPGRRVVPPRGHAVARPRPAARGAPGRAAGARALAAGTSTSRSAAARTAAASTTSPASASRAASGRSAGRPVPQYFVMLGGGVGEDGASLRPAGGQGAGAPRAGGGRAPARLVRRGARAGRGRRGRSCSRVAGPQGQAAARRPRGSRSRRRLSRRTSSTSASRARHGSSPAAAGSEGSDDHSLQEPA